MRTVVLLRHLKSSRDDRGLADHDRPLAPRGHRAGARVREHIAAAAVSPQLVLCSSAVRAVQTCEAVRPALPADAVVEIEDGLYLASSESLLSRLNKVSDAVEAALVIAHNPGIANLAQGLAGSGEGDAIDRMTAKYPTGALASLTFEGPWAGLAWGDADLAEFVVPRELPATG